MFILKYYDSNFGLFSIAWLKVIALLTIVIAKVVALKGDSKKSKIFIAIPLRAGKSNQEKKQRSDINNYKNYITIAIR